MPFLAIGFAAFASYFLLLHTETQHTFLETIINLVCAAVMFIGIRRNKPANKTGWYFILAGFAVFGLANIPSTYYVWRNGVQPFPSIGDAGYLMTEPLICIGLVLFMRSRKGVKRRKGNLNDAAILAVGAGLPIYALLIAPNLAAKANPLFSSVRCQWKYEVRSNWSQDPCDLRPWSGSENASQFRPRKKEKERTPMRTTRTNEKVEIAA
ncbi:MAG: hypothetical protein ACXVQ5_09440 [Actinomycetota bacterium]